MSKSLIPTKDNPHPLLKLEGKERQYFVIKSITITVVMTVGLYLFPSYYGLESITTSTSYFFLDLFGFHPRLFIYEDSFSELGAFDRYLLNLYDSTRATYPAISIDTNHSRSNYLIVRACTGMQAGALLLGLIWSTPAELHDRIKASYVILLALFIGNTLRIAAMIAITTILIENFGLDYETSWDFAHNWLGRPVGFFGTIGFTALIEMRGVKILDTITVWLDESLSWFSSKPKKASVDASD
ncbi:MAG: heimdallarchaeosortase [Candidatus Kariarchaeaceae archaeon]|jgi:exosortase/archaeosortase family protein